MRKHKTLDKAASFLKSIYIKLIKIDDTPHKIAVGFGLGVFAGVMPFAGPVAAIFLAVLFRVNRVSAFLGGLLTNTWITIIAFLLSVKIGSLIFGIDADIIRSRSTALLKDFHFANLFKLSALEIALPILAGYFVIAVISSAAVYIAVVIIMKFIRHGKRL